MASNLIHYDKSALIAQDYELVNQFIKEYDKLSYIEFDYYSVNKLNLFTIHENFDFNLLEETIDKITDSLSAIKRIFAKPIIHLVDQDVILPVESVKKINNETIIHASFHSELWEDVNKEGIKPRKLLTRNNIDNYSIYENIAFAHAINLIMGFCRRNLRYLKDFMYTNNTLNFNLLERVDHINYYLALGKLHTGYIRNFEKNYQIVDRCINKLSYIYNVISSRLIRPVYKKNANKDRNGFVLRTSNILKMHKDYHKVYLLLKYFSSNNIQVDDPMDDNLLEKMGDSYFNYCEILSIFSLGHFNFEVDKRALLDFEALDTNFRFKGWTLNLKKEVVDDIPVLVFDCNKDKTYRLILIPCSKPSNEGKYLKVVKSKLKGSKYVVVTPFEGDKTALYVSINNIESFRRIQQLVLRGMVYSDTKRDICPFCGSPLNEVKDALGKVHYECTTCRNVIEELECPETNKKYYATSIKDYHHFMDLNRRISNDNTWLFERKVEAQMHFRNITSIDANMDIICPHCGEVHQK